MQLVPTSQWGGDEEAVVTTELSATLPLYFSIDSDYGPQYRVKIQAEIPELRAFWDWESFPLIDCAAGMQALRSYWNAVSVVSLYFSTAQGIPLCRLPTF